MGLLDTLEHLLIPSKRSKRQRIHLKEVMCKPKKKDRIETFQTPAVGCEYKNIDGSDRQSALAKLKEGERVRLLWDAGKDGSKTKLYLVRGRRSQAFSLSNCFGRLSDKISSDVIRKLTQEQIATAARVCRIVGGTGKRPKLGCIIELTTYRTHLS